ncbi:MAG: alpha-D-ribose 1-methylphosphonate 5-triphosphate diphosphatase [Polaromonas sp.]|nr:alpha-D-ribose 1-methylphosphonate 5-triphosphate diphosphatase [Polaromonas sp.]
MSNRRSWAIVGGKTLLPSGLEDDAVVLVEDGVITDIADGTRGHPVLEAGGRLVLPGMIDLHGDAFERQLMPRPGVHFDMRIALADTDRQLVGNGISSAFHGVTHSWEPGLRSRDSLVLLMEALEVAQGHLACDTRLHLRHETFNLDGEAEALSWLAQGRVALLAFNDHTADIVQKLDNPLEAMTVLQRTGLGADALKQLAQRVASRSSEVSASIERLAAAAVAAGVPQASHDDTTPDVRHWYQGLSCRISEFPKNRETARAARALGNHVVFGSPNVVRGGSHQPNAVGAATMVAEGLCSVLTSDYFYPAMLQAPFRLVADGACSFKDAWALVSSNAADAAHLHDRGQLAVGQRADVLVVEPPSAMPARVALHLIAGRLAHVSMGEPWAPPVAARHKVTSFTEIASWVEP